eukprot:6483184-Amphidinium_carterae.1
MPGSALQSSMLNPPKRKPFNISNTGPAQPGRFQKVPSIPSRHRAREIVHRVSVPADSDIWTHGDISFHAGWGHQVFLTGPVITATAFPKWDSHAAAPLTNTARDQSSPKSGGFVGRGRGQSLASIFSPTHAGGWAQTKAPWCSWGPAQNPDLPMGNHLGNADGASPAKGRYRLRMGSPKCTGKPSGSGTKSSNLVVHQAGRHLEPLPARFSLGRGFEPGAGREGALSKLL